MLGYFTPSSWFLIFMALLLSCYIKMTQHYQPYAPAPYAQASFIKKM